MVLILFFLTLIFFWENVFLGKVFYFGDNFNLFIPNKIFFANELKKGIFPLWNPLILSGTPYIADLGIFPFYPGNIFFLIFPPENALAILAIFQVFLAGVFMFSYLKLLGFDDFFGLFGAVVFMFSGTVISHIGNISILNVIIWLPLILYFLEKSFLEKKFKNIFLTAIFLTISFLGGHLQFFYYNSIFLCIYLLFKIKATSRIKLIKGLMVFIIFIGLSAFQALPFWEYANLSTRPVADFSYATEGSLAPIVLLRLFFAEIYGRLKDGYSWGPAAPMERGFADVTGYIGVLPLLLIFIMGIFKKKETFFWLGTLFLSLLLSLGKYTPIYFLFFKLTPFFNRFRNPAQFLFLYTFTGTILSVYGLDFLLRKKVKRTKIFKIILWTLTVFLFLISGIFLKTLFDKAFLFLIAENRQARLTDEGVKNVLAELARIPRSLLRGSSFMTVKGFFEKILHKPLVFSRAYNDEKIIIILNLFIKNFFFFILTLYLFFISFYFYIKRKVSLRILKIILFLIIFFDLFLYSKNSLFIADKKVFDVPDETVIFLKKNLKPYERFLSTSEIIPYTGLFNYWNQTMVRKPFGESRVNEREIRDFAVLKEEISVLPPDLGMNFNLLTVNGYSPMILKNYADFWDSRKESRNINNVFIADFRDEKINLTGIKYLIISKKLDKEVKKIERIKNFKLVFSGKFVKIYENKKTYPRAFLLSNGEIIDREIIDYQQDKVIVKVKKSDRGLLVLTDNNYPDWEVSLNGKKAKISDYKNTFKSVRIDGGVKEVIFLFRPKLFYFGVIISFLTLILCLLKLAF